MAGFWLEGSTARPGSGDRDSRLIESCRIAVKRGTLGKSIARQWIGGGVVRGLPRWSAGCARGRDQRMRQQVERQCPDRGLGRPPPAPPGIRAVEQGRLARTEGI